MSPSSPLRQPLGNQLSSFPNTTSGRGGQWNRYRGKGRGGSVATHVIPSLESERPIMDMEYLGAFIGDVTLDPDPTSYPTAAVDNVDSIASYSWLDKITPTIAVPGNATILLTLASD